MSNNNNNSRVEIDEQIREVKERIREMKQQAKIEYGISIMSDWEILIDAVQELYLPKLSDENISIETFTKTIGKTTSILGIAARIAEEEGEKEKWERQSGKVWKELVSSPAGQKYFGKDNF